MKAPGRKAPGKATKAPRRRTRAALRHRSVATPGSEIVALRRELAEAKEQQAATADVLRIIASSPGDLEPVFKAMLANAVRICGAKFGTLYRYDGKTLHVAALQTHRANLQKPGGKRRCNSAAKPQLPHSIAQSRRRRRCESPMFARSRPTAPIRCG